ncbi:MAG: hypothetical protein LBQ77_00315 [Treponema sp.]|nr:hypothetical protein [Treponema sp.]
MEPEPVTHWNRNRLLIEAGTGYSLKRIPVAHWNRNRLLIGTETSVGTDLKGQTPNQTGTDLWGQTSMKKP